MFKVLVIATSRKTRGGITSVVKAHEKGEQWNDYHCKWIETHIDKNGKSTLGHLPVILDVILASILILLKSTLIILSTRKIQGLLWILRNLF